MVRSVSFWVWVLRVVRWLVHGVSADADGVEAAVGAEFTKVYARRNGDQIVPDAHAVPRHR